MRVVCSATLGFTANNSIVRIKGGLKTRFDDKSAKSGDFASAVSADGTLSVLISLNDGAIAGISYMGDISALPPTSYKAGMFTDGRVIASVPLLQGCAYVFLKSGCASYDKTCGAVTFGKCGDGCLVIRVCKNLYVYLDQNNFLCGIAALI